MKKAKNAIEILGIVFILLAQMSLVYEMGQRSVMMEIVKN